MGLDFPGLFGDNDIFRPSFDDNQVPIREGSRVVPSFRDDVKNVYTGAGFDSNHAGTVSHTFQISAKDLRNSKYLVVTVGYRAHAHCGAANNKWATLRIERNETGQASWSDVLVANKVVFSLNIGWTNNADTLADTTHFILLTDAEKKNGIDVRVTSYTSTAGVGGSASFNNIGTTFELRN